MVGRRPRTTAVIAALIALGLSAALLAGCGDEEDGGDATSAGSSAGLSGVGSTEDISGPWTGTLTQSGLAPFRIAVVIGADGFGVVGYTGIDCGGRWRLTAAEAGPARYEFEERIDRGAGGECKGTGEVTLRPLGAEDEVRRLRYEFAGGGVDSRGVLARVGDLDDLRPILERAGVGVASAELEDAPPEATGTAD